MKPRTLILRTAGTNCDTETAHAFELAGALAECVHLNRVLENPNFFDDFQLLAIPGGFSYGDDIAAGRIFANQIVHHLRDAFRRFIDAGKPVIGVCNGFQVLIKTDLLPGPIAGRTGQTCTLTNNDTGRFIDRWVGLTPHPSHCVWTQGLEPLELPIAHGEGKFVPADETVRKALWNDRHVALTYTHENPNGSADAIAGICDSSGVVLGLMPHPERYVTPLQHPAWARGKLDKTLSEGTGLRLFRNAVAHVFQGVGRGL